MTDHLLVWREGRLGRIRLNRPAALNALTLEMLRALDAALDNFIADPEIVAIYADGAGDRGFCAGGDIRTLYEKRDSAPDYYKQFWRIEYPLNARIASLSKPYIVLMDGLVMGAGIGVSAHGRHRIVTPRTRFAMPETQIGFLPDTGGTWLLGQRGPAGTYLALTGASIGAGDLLHLGLADNCVDPTTIADLTQRLSQATTADDVSAILAAAQTPAPPAMLIKQENLLSQAFETENVEMSIDVLQKSGGVFAEEACARLLSASPTSLKLTRRLLTLARRAAQLEDELINEYRAACSLLAGHDLYEGIRAAIIDRDKNPRWAPATLAGVDDDVIDALLRGTGDPDPVFATG